MTAATKREIFWVSGVVGICLLAFLGLGRLYSYLLVQLARNGLYPSSYIWDCIVQMVYSLVCVMGPFVLGAKAISKLQKREEDLIPFKKPVSWNYMGMGVAVCFFATIALNLLSAYFSTFLERFGVTFTNSPSTVIPDNVPDYIFLVLSNVLVPALAEEFACRGVILQGFRKYGDVWAIAISSIIFGLMHGNMSQAPFAMLLGAIIARMVILTDSIWTGILIHMLNNTYAIVMLTLNDRASQMTLAVFAIIVDTVAVMMGVIALVWLIGYYRALGARTLNRPGGNYPAARTEYRHQVELWTIVAPTMAIAIVYFLYKLFSTIQIGVS